MREKRWWPKNTRPQARDGTQATELVQTENGVVAPVFEVRGCRDREASGLVEMVQMLRGTVRYVMMESIAVRTVMTWAV